MICSCLELINVCKRKDKIVVDCNIAKETPAFVHSLQHSNTETHIFTSWTPLKKQGDPCCVSKVVTTPNTLGISEANSALSLFRRRRVSVASATSDGRGASKLIATVIVVAFVLACKSDRARFTTEEIPFGDSEAEAHSVDASRCVTNGKDCTFPCAMEPMI